MRRTLGLPARTRSALLPGLAGSGSFSQQHHSRVKKYVTSLKNSKNSAVDYLYMKAQSNTIGPLGKNIAYLKICPSVDQSHPVQSLDSRISQIRELIRLRDGIDQLDVLNRNELQDILEFLCVS